jgi:hypothetical protein
MVRRGKKAMRNLTYWQRVNIMKRRKGQKYENPVAKALNRVTKPVTITDKKKENNKTLCRKRKGIVDSL